MKAKESQKWMDIFARCARQINQKPSKVSFGYAEQAIRRSPFRPIESGNAIEVMLDNHGSLNRIKILLAVQTVQAERMRCPTY